jgi:hypothetical protein
MQDHVAGSGVQQDPVAGNVDDAVEMELGGEAGRAHAVLVRRDSVAHRQAAGGQVVPGE